MPREVIDCLYKFNGDDVELGTHDGRPIIVASAGYDVANIDLFPLFAWLKEKHPEILYEAQDKGYL